MKNRIFVLIATVLVFSPTVFAETQNLLISVNKTVPQDQAQAVAAKLERVDPNMSTCYVQSHVQQYIPYESCTKDETCPYWGVAIVELAWKCDLPLKLWIDEILKNPDYTIYSNGRIGPFPIVSGGN